MNDRSCIVTRKPLPAEALIRFVAGPDGTVVPDLKRRLPGRGCWVTAERALVDEAARRQLFARALKAKAVAPAALGAEVDNRLMESLLGAIGLARKAGQCVFGLVKVDGAVRSGRAIAVFHAPEASADGACKIDQARRVAARLAGSDRPVPSFRLLASADLKAVAGREGIMHAAVLAGQAGEGVVKRAMLLERYRHGAGEARALHADRPRTRRD